MKREKQTYFTRFSMRQRVEHFLVMVLFLILALTGFPQKFFESGWAQWIISILGGIDRVRWLHRLSGILFSLVAIGHLGVVVALAMTRRVEGSKVCFSASS